MDFYVISLFYDRLCMPEILFAYIIALTDMPNSSLLHLHFDVLEMIIPQKCSTTTIFYNEKESNIFRICQSISHSPKFSIFKKKSLFAGV